MTFTTRFAPSPTGPLHLGHAYSALLAHDMSRAAGGTFLLRIEDTDTSRCRPEWEAQIYEDLHWLGLTWPTPVMRQSNNLPRHQSALDHLANHGLIYPCSCRRADIRAAASAPQEGAEPAFGPDGMVYPGTCRSRPMDSAEPGDALRINMSIASQLSINIAEFHETGPLHPGTHILNPQHLIAQVGDVVLQRRDIEMPAYHLAVVLDDAAQGITHVIRGADLFEATQIHVLLQNLLNLPTPTYHHHPLIRDDTGKRLAKRDDARAIATYRAAGTSPTDIRKMIGL